jgi:hypothetical protein
MEVNLKTGLFFPDQNVDTILWALLHLTHIIHYPICPVPRHL